MVDLPDGGHVVHYRDGAMASVSVVADADGVRRLHIDNRQQEGSSATQLADARQALLPLLLHPAPKRALFLVVGTGVTAAAAAQDPSLKVDAVDLLPELLEATVLFMLATNSLETPVVGLIGRAADLQLDLEATRLRIADPNQTLRLDSHGLSDDWAVPGSLIAGPKARALWAGDAPLNTDDRPVVAYRSPAITYAPDSRPRDRLISLLQALPPTSPADLFGPAPDAAWQSRWTAYQAARLAFLHADMAVRPSSDVNRMLAQVREPLLGVLRISSDFEPARMPLRRMALALTDQDPAAANALLKDLEGVRAGQSP